MYITDGAFFKFWFTQNNFTEYKVSLFCTKLITNSIKLAPNLYDDSLNTFDILD